MLLRRGSLAGGIALALTVLGSPSNDAHACGGGFFVQESEIESTSVTGHRVAISISTTQTVLWDQIVYNGAPSEFAWILPVKDGAYLELGADSWLEALDATTNPVVHSPMLECAAADSGSSGIGCGASALNDRAGGGPQGDLPKESVDVIHRGTVGPYENVTLSTETPGALSKWLADHSFAVPSDAAPILDDYVAQGYDFIAVRLKPSAGIEEMRPLRVVTPGPITTFPLRMLSIGSKEKVALKLFVLTEGRASVQNFPNAEIHGEDLTWDFDENRSNYADVRGSKIFAKGADAPWLTVYSQSGYLLAPREGYFSETPTGGRAETIADAYFSRGVANGETTQTCGSADFKGAGTSTDKVVDLCPPGSSSCIEPNPGELNADIFTCASLDDLSVAITGMHPADVWLTRLEAELPREALSMDLQITTVVDSSAGGEHSNHLFVAKGENVASDCSAVSAEGLEPLAMLGGSPRDFAMGAVVFAALGAGLGRRAARRKENRRS